MDEPKKTDTGPPPRLRHESLTTMKAASIPMAVPKDICNLKPQISAPSYLNSLKENDAPPFRRPEREPRAKLVIGTIVTDEDVVTMIAAAESDPGNGFRRLLGDFLVEKKIISNYALPEKRFLISLVTEAVHYAAQRDFSPVKLACLLTIYLCSHLYFKRYYWSPPAALWEYFMELMIRHTIEDSPDGQEVFHPEECYDIASHFHTAYLTNLPLIHTMTFGAHRLKFVWPIKSK